MATGCVSCAADVGQLRQALASYPGVQAVGIDIVPQDTPTILASFLENQDLTDAPLLWTIDTYGSLVARYQTAMLDATVGIDSHGGAHILAEAAGEVITPAVYAIKFHLTIADLTETFHPYLTMAEGLKLAAQTFTRDVAKLSCCAA